MTPGRSLLPFATPLLLGAYLVSCQDDPMSEGDNDGSAGSGMQGPCAFDIDQTVSPAIGTVGIVRFSVPLPGLKHAKIEFGPDDELSSTAPVDLDEPDFRTLLLGMPPSTEVSFRIVAEGTNRVCTSETLHFTTGPSPNGTFLPETVEASQPEKVAPGYMVTSQFLSGRSLDTGPDGAVAFILDHLGRVVWWYQTPLRNISRALLSYDGKHLYARNVNVGLSAREGQVFKVSMDGLDAEMFDLSTSHHDMAPVPDGSMAIIRKEQGNGTCDEILLLRPDATLKRVYSMRDAYPSGTHPDSAGEECHCNSIHYNIEDDTFTISDLYQNSYTKVTSSGALVWVLGGADSHFEGVDWHRQHGHHMVSPSRIFFFNNNSSFEDSLGLDVTLDLKSKRADVWKTPKSGFSSTTLGDAQVLQNENYLLTYSNQGVIQELDSEGAPVQTIAFRAGGALGYVNHRPTLYGPPPR